MNILLTGGAGYIGSIALARLLGWANEVTVFDRLIYGGEGLTPHLGNPAFSYVAGGLEDDAALDGAMRGKDAVIHLAALVGDKACAFDAERTKKINQHAPLKLYEMAKRFGVSRFLFISTCSNYGVSDPGTLADETATLRPLTLYAETKVAAEQALLSAAASQTALTILRLGTIYGLAPRMRFDLLINQMARDAALGTPIDVFKPNAWRPYLHIEDAARAFQHILHCPADALQGEVFNLVSANYTKHQLMELVKRAAPHAVFNVTDGAADLRDYRVSAAKAESRLGFRPSIDALQAILAMVEALKNGLYLDPCAAPLGADILPVNARRLSS